MILYAFLTRAENSAKHNPANADAIPAIKNDINTAGPACAYATDPAKTYTPRPSVLPIPNPTRSNNVSTLANCDLPPVSITFRRVKFLSIFQFFLLVGKCQRKFENKHD